MVSAGQLITAAAMSDAQLKAVARGNRTSTKTTVTTEVGVLRIDDVPHKASSIYMIAVSGLVWDSGSSTGVIYRLRRSTTGAATTSSTEFGAKRIAAATIDTIDCFFTIYLTGGTDENVSWLLTVAREGGTDASELDAATQGIHLVPIYLGAQPSDTGVDI